jgi:hypothetical protein
MFDADHLELIFINLFALLGAAALGFFFFRTQYRTLLAIKPVNRLLAPALVWLQFIPCLNLILQFVVIIQIARSIRKEKHYRMEESLMNSTPVPQLPAATYPTLATGIAYAVLSFGFTFFNLFSTYEPDTADISKVSIDTVYHPGPGYYLRHGFPFVCVLAALVCWIIYWVSLAHIRKELTRTAILQFP